MCVTLNFERPCVGMCSCHFLLLTVLLETYICNFVIHIFLRWDFAFATAFSNLFKCFTALHIMPTTDIVLSCSDKTFSNYYICCFHNHSSTVSYAFIILSCLSCPILQITVVFICFLSVASAISLFHILKTFLLCNFLRISNVSYTACTMHILFCCILLYYLSSVFIQSVVLYFVVIMSTVLLL